MANCLCLQVHRADWGHAGQLYPPTHNAEQSARIALRSPAAVMTGPLAVAVGTRSCQSVSSSRHGLRSCCSESESFSAKFTRMADLFRRPQPGGAVIQSANGRAMSLDHTHDQQTLSLQMRAMREYAAKRGWTITVQIREVGSGAAERELRENLLTAARRREIDVVLVWRLDRWGRSLVDVVVTLKELAGLGVSFVSLTEALDLTTPTGSGHGGSAVCVC
jgi:hypothetical protein